MSTPHRLPGVGLVGSNGAEAMAKSLSWPMKGRIYWRDLCRRSNAEACLNAAARRAKT